MALERYQLIAELGRGGTADVFLAVARGLSGFNKLVVVKSLRADDDELVEMFLDEGRLAARLNHPNVVQTNEVGREGDNHYLVMEFLDGQTLRQLTRSKDARMPLAIHLRILCDVLNGLQYAHTLTDFDGTPLGIVHRDVSPHNVFVTYEGVTKLLDFGIAKAASREVETTQSGMLKGKVAYMAPEQGLGSRNIDARADLFAVGVMLFEAASGQRMWKDATEYEVLRRLDHAEIPRLADEAPDAPAWMRPICDRALAFRAEDRYANAAELLQALEDGMEANGLRATSKDVAKFITSRFTEERERLRKAIDARLRDLEKERETEGEEASFGKVPRLASQVEGTDRSPAGSSRRREPRRVWPLESEPPLEEDERRAAQTLTGQRGAIESPVEATEPMSRARMAVIAVAATVVVLFLLFGLPTLLPPATTVDSGRDLATQPSEVGVPSATVASSSAPSASSSAAAPKMVAIDLEAVPADAKLFLDGKPVANPAHLTVPSDGSSHELRAEAAGRRTETTKLTYDRDQTHKLALEKIVAPPASVTQTKPPPPASTTAQPPKPDCSNPFYIDDRGIKTLRPECR